MPNEATEVKWTNVKGTVSSEWTQEGMKLPALFNSLIHSLIECDEVNATTGEEAQFMPQFNLHFIPLRRCGIEVNWMQAMNGVRSDQFQSIYIHSVKRMN